MRFFFSYSRQNNDDYLLEFFRELHRTVVELSGTEEAGGFMDQTGLEIGEAWESALEKALRQARVLVAAVTPGYVLSPFCGKEWGAFHSRVAKFAAGQGGDAPPVILPLLWIPSEEPWPAAISAQQYTQGNPADIVNKKGLKYLCRLKALYPEDYANYLETLAKKIVSLSKKYAALDTITELPPLRDAPSPFAQAGTPPGTSTTSGGARHVHFVFSVARPAEIRQAGKQSIESYGDRGGAWQPFFPTVRTIDRIANQSAAADQVNLWAHEMDFSEKLPDLIREAEVRRELVIIFVDRWTALLDRYGDTLRKFDKQNYENCSVFVPFNEKDAEAAPNLARLQAALQQTLRFRVQTRNDLYFRGNIDSEQALREQLVDVLVRLQAEVIKSSIPPSGSVPAGPGRPVLSGPG